VRSLARAMTKSGFGPDYPSPRRGAQSGILKLQGAGSVVAKRAYSLVLDRNFPVVP
jgi:hypothetical protein